MGAPVHHGGEADVAADEEDSNAFGGVHLVPGEGEEVDVFEGAFGGEVERELAGDLDGVGVEEGSGFVGDGGQFLDGLDDAGLVVGVHDGDEFGVGPEGGFEGRGFDEAFGGAGEEGDLNWAEGSDSGFVEGFGGVEDGVVLDVGGDEVGRAGLI